MHAHLFEWLLKKTKITCRDKNLYNIYSTRPTKLRVHYASCTCCTDTEAVGLPSCFLSLDLLCLIVSSATRLIFASTAMGIPTFFASRIGLKPYEGSFVYRECMSLIFPSNGPDRILGLTGEITNSISFCIKSRRS